MRRFEHTAALWQLCDYISLAVRSQGYKKTSAVSFLTTLGSYISTLRDTSLFNFFSAFLYDFDTVLTGDKLNAVSTFKDLLYFLDLLR
jgi:hypothetical protein